MPFTTTQLISIANAGGGLIIDAQRFTTTNLVSIANASRRSGAKITLTNLRGKTTTNLISIANAGQGNIVFDIREGE